MLFQQWHHSLHLHCSNIILVLLAAASVFHFPSEKSMEVKACSLRPLSPQLLPGLSQDGLTAGTISWETPTHVAPRITSGQLALPWPPADLQVLTGSNSMIFSLMSLRQKQNYFQATSLKSQLLAPCKIRAIIDLRRWQSQGRFSIPLATLCCCDSNLTLPKEDIYTNRHKSILY